MAFAAGTRLGVYEITGLIGVGGMGEVYKACDSRLDRVVAIKVLPEHIAGDPDLRHRLQREAKAISVLSHPHICTLYDIGNEDGTEFLVMEYLEGESLAQRLAKGPLPLQQVLRYGVEIAEALDRAHRQGVTHRDLKPGNVMLTKAGAKLLDFGLAKLKPAALQRESGSEPTVSPELTSSGMILGTLQYMAPEQVEGKAVDHRADIFSFGAILYEMATGKKAFKGGSQASLIGTILRDDPQPISVSQPMSPSALDALVSTCLAKDPDDRWQSAGDLGRQLRLMQGSAPHARVLPSAATSPRSAWQLNPARVLGALVAASALAAIALWLFMRPAAEHAEAEIVPAGSPIVAGTATAPSPLLPNSIAVLPFDNLSPDESNAFFAAGIHDEVLNQLGKLKSLNVIARTSVMQYANAARPIAEIARELNVETVMNGSVSYADGRVAVRAQLSDGSTGVNLWSESYDREFAEIFAIQADIAMNIANAIRAEFSIEEQQDIEREATDSPAAYALFLQARGLVGSSGAVARMHELYDQAIAIDSDFAAVYAWKAVLYAQELVNTPEGAARPWTELEPRIREYAAKALELDRAQPVAYAALSTLLLFSWRWTDFRQTRDRSPTTTLVGPVTSWSKAWLDNPTEALEVAQRGVDLNPLDWLAHWAQGVSLTYAHDYAAASAKFREGIALVPVVPQQRSMLGLAQAALGNTDEARRQLELAEQLSSAPMLLADVAYGYGRIGDAENARRVFEEIVAATGQGQDIGVGGWALAHLAVGDTDEALAWLERGADKARRHEPDPGFFALMNLRMNFTADPVLERPEFVDVRNRLRGD